jgi:mercuric ion transport protein
MRATQAMDASSPKTIKLAAAEEDLSGLRRGHAGRQRLAAAGGIFGALGASSCCIVPLALFSLGIGGAWIGKLTALAPYKPLFVAATAAILAYGFVQVYWRPKQDCAEGMACARPLPARFVKFALWFATALLVVAFAFDYISPVLLGI